QLLAGDLPDLDRLIDRGRDDVIAVAAEGHRADPVAVPAEALRLLAGAALQPPQLDHLVAAPGGQVLAVGPERDRAARPAGPGPRQRPRGRLVRPPDAHQLIGPAGRQPPAVTAEGQRTDRGRMRHPVTDRFAADRVPQPHLLVGRARGNLLAVRTEG